MSIVIVNRFTCMYTCIFAHFELLLRIVTGDEDAIAVTGGTFTWDTSLDRPILNEWVITCFVQQVEVLCRISSVATMAQGMEHYTLEAGAHEGQRAEGASNYSIGSTAWTFSHSFYINIWIDTYCPHFCSLPTSVRLLLTQAVYVCVQHSTSPLVEALVRPSFNNSQILLLIVNIF